jgi:hypothetical protein
LLPRKNPQNLLLMFEAKEGMVVAIVAYKRTQDPPAHICSEGWGWPLLPTKEHKIPLLMFAVREGWWL